MFYFGAMNIWLLLLFVSVVFGQNCSATEKLECLSWWRWDSPSGCRERGCCSDDLLKCSYPKSKTPVGRVYVVQGCHFDVGFVKPSTEIINMWFHQFFPLAYQIGSALEQNQTSAARLKFTAESWVSRPSLCFESVVVRVFL